MNLSRIKILEDNIFSYKKKIIQNYKSIISEKFQFLKNIPHININIKKTKFLARKIM